MTGQADLDTLCINTIRFLSADGVQKANSGHPGLPMGAAPMAYVLWTKYLKHNPANPGWADRDRFVLSAGHGSMLLYSLLHLTGYDLPIEQLQSFRQWGSRTPGHPENHVTKGVEATTGPLGQGISNAVGLAIAESHLAARYNRPGHDIVDHRTFVIASDGDMMEGVASEACSLAGHLALSKLTVLYDDNKICLAGSTSLSFNEDVARRFEGYGWHVRHVADGLDLAAIDAAIAEAEAETTRPSIILVRNTIGYGAPDVQGTYKAHGSPLGDKELAKAKANLGWPAEPSFLVPPEAKTHFREALARGGDAEKAWQARWSAYEKAFPELAVELKRRLQGELPKGWEAALPVFDASDSGIATRNASEDVMQQLAAAIPELVGGSADLNNSTLTWLKGEGDFEPAGTTSEGAQGQVGGVWGPAGRNLHFGIREHAMGAAVNGLALHGGFVPYGSTFLVFSDYMRGSIRLSAISRLGSIWVFTHDSIGVGEDGPTHQPVEHYAALRAIPELLFFRPADANETAWAWRMAITNRHRPSVLSLTRQKVPTLDRSRFAGPEGLARGAYVLNPEVDRPELILMASGSEVGLIVDAAKQLAADRIKVRLVSMPCWELFEEQEPSYRDAVLPPSVRARLGVESGVTLGWERWTGSSGATVTLDRFGASAPGPTVMKELGFTVENVVARARTLLR